MNGFLSRLFPAAADNKGGAAQGELSGVSKLVIGGTDERVSVSNIEDAPWRTFCCLKITFTGDESRYGYGTGLLIRPNIILTAAHNLYSLQAQTFARAITVMAGVKDGAPAAEARVKRVEVCPGYNQSLPTDLGRYRRDFGIAVVDSDALYRWAGEYVDVASQPLITDGEFARSSLNVAGYPDERPTNPKICLKSDFGPIIPGTMSATNFSYRMDTMPGQSGCPVFKYNAQQKRLIFAGVHVAGDKSANTARRFDPFMQAQVKEWLSRYA